ncbi:MAG: hypothetical protein LBT25_13705 [Candidatus Symbiothrix sp.]|jgi:hypothetical protein|nr:hypothetical protein [Candidatus Symbiothrix sp.]
MKQTVLISAKDDLISALAKEEAFLSVMNIRHHTFIRYDGGVLVADGA